MRRLIFSTGVAIIAAGAAAWTVASRMPPLALDRAADVSTIVLDRRDKLLRAFTTKDGKWRLAGDPANVDARYVSMLLAFEDKRFWSHSGVDWYAAARAVRQFAANGRIVSGASTLTMQVARLLDRLDGRSAQNKARQIVRAFELERRFTKTEILRLYLALAPMGGNIEGVRAASLAYFNKEPSRLGLAEAALLVALPQSPETRRPDRDRDAALRARNRVLDRAAAAMAITEAEAVAAKAEPMAIARHDFPALAPHLSDAEAGLDPAKKVHRLTLDRDLQASLETLAAERARSLGRKLSAAILVIENRTGEALAYVGSAGYFDGERLGPVDMVSAVRSPGSALKPFIYGLAFESGQGHPETLIEDRPVRFGFYRPKNFDEGYRGAVTMREALALSLNVPAVKTLNAVGPVRFTERLRRAGVAVELPPGTAPTLAIALGGVGVRMLDLASLYATLARGGDPVAVNWRKAATQPAGRRWRKRRLLSRAASWSVADILKDAPPPPAAVGGQIAYKTGTSYGYRDAWAIGFDGRHTVAVWAGRADGTGTPGLLGRTAAAPILFDAFARLGGVRARLLPKPPGVLIAEADGLPPPLKRFHGDAAEAAQTGPFLQDKVSIAFPPDRSEVEVAGAEEPIQLKAEGGVLPLTWLVDGAPIPSDPHRRETTWMPPGKGFFRLSILDAAGRTDRAVVRLKD